MIACAEIPFQEWLIDRTNQQSWRIFSSKMHTHRQNLFIGIYDDSLTVLKEQDFKAFFALVSVQIKMHERNHEEPVFEAPVE